SECSGIIRGKGGRRDVARHGTFGVSTLVYTLCTGDRECRDSPGGRDGKIAAGWKVETCWANVSCSANKRFDKTQTLERDRHGGRSRSRRGENAGDRIDESKLQGHDDHR